MLKVHTLCTILNVCLFGSLISLSQRSLCVYSETEFTLNNKGILAVHFSLLMCAICHVDCTTLIMFNSMLDFSHGQSKISMSFSCLL